MHLKSITPILKEHFEVVVSRPTTCLYETIFHIEPCCICQLLRVSSATKVCHKKKKQSALGGLEWFG